MSSLELKDNECKALKIILTQFKNSIPGVNCYLSKKGNVKAVVGVTEETYDISLKLKEENIRLFTENVNKAYDSNFESVVVTGDFCSSHSDKWNKVFKLVS